MKLERFELDELPLHIIVRNGRQWTLLAPLARELGIPAARRRSFDAETRMRRRIETLDISGERQPALPIERLPMYLLELLDVDEGISPAARGRVFRLRRSLIRALKAPKSDQLAEPISGPGLISNVGEPQLRAGPLLTPC